MSDPARSALPRSRAAETASDPATASGGAPFFVIVEA